MPHDKQMLDACEGRDPTSIGDVPPSSFPAWYGISTRACGVRRVYGDMMARPYGLSCRCRDRDGCLGAGQTSQVLATAESGK
ncbi:hypothetical protein CaCOL14_013344 [Colletotrichum acutatum]